MLAYLPHWPGFREQATLVADDKQTMGRRTIWADGADVVFTETCLPDEVVSADSTNF